MDGREEDAQNEEEDAQNEEEDSEKGKALKRQIKVLTKENDRFRRQFLLCKDTYNTFNADIDVYNSKMLALLDEETQARIMEYATDGRRTFEVDDVDDVDDVDSTDRVDDASEVYTHLNSMTFRFASKKHQFYRVVTRLVLMRIRSVIVASIRTKGVWKVTLPLIQKGSGRKWSMLSLQTTVVQNVLMGRVKEMPHSDGDSNLYQEFMMRRDSVERGDPWSDDANVLASLPNLPLKVHARLLNRTSAQVPSWACFLMMLNEVQRITEHYKRFIRDKSLSRPMVCTRLGSRRCEQCEFCACTHDGCNYDANVWAPPALWNLYRDDFV